MFENFIIKYWEAEHKNIDRKFIALNKIGDIYSLSWQQMVKFKVKVSTSFVKSKPLVTC